MCDSLWRLKVTGMAWRRFEIGGPDCRLSLRQFRRAWTGDGNSRSGTRRAWAFALATVLVAALGFVAPSAAAGEIRAALYGTTRGGRAVMAYTLLNDTGASATIIDFGGTIIDLRVPDRRGRMGNVVMSFADLAGWEAVGNANAIVGRYANRIRGGFTIDGLHYPLQQNAAGITLHGGPPPYSTRIWSVVPHRPDDGAAVTLTLLSPDGDQGFPGTVRIAVTYRLTDDNTLRLDLMATTDATTVINLTNHIYFNLNGNSTTSVAAHRLKLDADSVAVRDPTNVPTGMLVSVLRTPLDLSQGRKLEHLVEAADVVPFAEPDPDPSTTGTVRSFDYAYLLNDSRNPMTRVAARLEDDASGRIMELRTTEPSIQVFITTNARPGLLSDVGQPLAATPAVALETQHLPDSPNQPSFPSTILRPGEVFRSSTSWTFTARDHAN